MSIRVRRAVLVALVLVVLTVAAVLAVLAVTRTTPMCGCSVYPARTTTAPAPTGPSRA